MIEIHPARRARARSISPAGRGEWRLRSLWGFWPCSRRHGCRRIEIPSGSTWGVLHSWQDLRTNDQTERDLWRRHYGDLCGGLTPGNVSPRLAPVWWIWRSGHACGALFIGTTKPKPRQHLGVASVVAVPAFVRSGLQTESNAGTGEHWRLRCHAGWSEPVTRNPADPLFGSAGFGRVRAAVERTAYQSGIRAGSMPQMSRQ